MFISRANDIGEGYADATTDHVGLNSKEQEAQVLPSSAWRSALTHPTNCFIIVSHMAKRVCMATVDDLVRRQKDGAQFVISAQMLRLKPQEFDPIAQRWLDDGGPGFNVVGVPHRSVVDGNFLISRVTVIRTTAPV